MNVQQVGRLKEEIERERERREEERHKWMLEAEHIRKIGKERGALEVEIMVMMMMMMTLVPWRWKV